MQKKRYIKRIEALFIEIDKNVTGSLQLNEFFDIIEIIEAKPLFKTPNFPDLRIWNIVRSYLNKWLRFKKISK